MMKGVLLTSSLSLLVVASAAGLRGEMPSWIFVPAGGIGLLFGVLFILLERARIPVGLHLRGLILMEGQPA